ncbi:unnamed protein product [Allacma fusca]|uniref:Uncharacterized protein n=1 Tax=Allacma fusca TaxID=39272 RepID=A0A8J2LSF3_9HEXA|nr:unnamed protein product [Allacma fusca]
MTSTPKSIGEESLSESWVDIGVNSGRVTPVAVPAVGLVNGSPIASVAFSGQLASHIGEEYLRLLKEAQRESNHSSARVSLASSLRGSRCESPKSPPNSPNTELSNEDEELKGIFINKESEGSKEWIINYWNARCDRPSKTEENGKNAKVGFRKTKIEGKSIFCKEMVYTLFLSNFLSLLLGAGIGLWISRRSAVISQYP